MSTRVARLPRRRDDVRLFDKELRSFLVAPEQALAHELNPTARAVWELCDGETTVAELADAVCQLFPITHDDAVADVVAVVDRFVDAGLVEWSGGSKEGP
jgi:hypothetical protein